MKNVAQLIKLSDYISRYEQGLSHYTTQFLRLKKYQWDRLRIQWENNSFDPIEEVEQAIEKKPTFLQSITKKFQKQEEEEAVQIDEEIAQQFQPVLNYRPTTVQQLKKIYEEQLYQFQMKWASSTLLASSTIGQHYKRDVFLKDIVQQLPDHYLILYEPILQIKKAPLDVNILILTPLACYSITMLNQEDAAVYVGSGDRFWTKKYKTYEYRMLSPMIELNRTAKILQQLFLEQDIHLPIKKVVLTKNGYIDFPSASYDVEVVDRKNYEEYMQELIANSSPMKSAQFRAANYLLSIAQTTVRSELFAQPESEEQDEIKK